MILRSSEAHHDEHLDQLLFVLLTPRRSINLETSGRYHAPAEPATVTSIPIHEMIIRQYAAADFSRILAIINDASQAYRGVIPADRWHDPYMSSDELAKEIADGVNFWVAEQDGRVEGVMGIQDRGDVALVRHAYVVSAAQGSGIGTRLIRHVETLVKKPILIGTWAAATWAIRFYERNGYINLPGDEKNRLLRKYWSIPERQVETSVVLARGEVVLP